MATIQNDRDVLLQAAATRFVPPPIDPSLIPGYEDALEDIDDLKDSLGDLGDEINHLMNNSRDLRIYATTLTFTNTSGTTTPSSTTLTAVKGSGLTGTVSWSVVAGSATLSSSIGDSITVTGSTISGRSATIRARVTMSGANYDAYVTLTRLGAIAASNVVNLTSQVTGSLAAGNVSGLGALALLNTVNLSTQTTGALNGLTQVTNLGNLAYANSVAANQIGAGTLAAGVIYAGAVNAEQINSGAFVGKTFTGGTFTGSLFNTSNSSSRALFGYTSPDNPSFISIRVESTSNPDSIFTEMRPDRLTVLNTSNTAPVFWAWGKSTSFHTAIIIGGLQIESTNNVLAPLRLLNVTSLPSNRDAGSICFHNGWLCFANGSHWFRSDGVQLT